MVNKKCAIVYNYPQDQTLVLNVLCY